LKAQKFALKGKYTSALYASLQNMIFVLSTRFDVIFHFFSLTRWNWNTSIGVIDLVVVLQYGILYSFQKYLSTCL